MKKYHGTPTLRNLRWKKHSSEEGKVHLIYLNISNKYKNEYEPYPTLCGQKYDGFNNLREIKQTNATYIMDNLCKRCKTKLKNMNQETHQEIEIIAENNRNHPDRI
ncbi:hypothetical protein AMET1_0540 [Methanonatronarchaeum thermophilum]|uniref:Uncharacterized protein n=1 Tax=Methanonatronarchaeum thermophilum TaxID=1927129 RepID=A0A1Y3GBU4_9EURY|nr:hypothetical protein [Methanonatronarchaeum thermophilum]OUJ18889.1 hypothetical protein AMET1_0540 [Methanonatronarchaeum thermophilum]